MCTPELSPLPWHITTSFRIRLRFSLFSSSALWQLLFPLDVNQLKLTSDSIRKSILLVNWIKRGHNSGIFPLQWIYQWQILFVQHVWDKNEKAELHTDTWVDWRHVLSCNYWLLALPPLPDFTQCRWSAGPGSSCYTSADVESLQICGFLSLLQSAYYCNNEALTASRILMHLMKNGNQ